MKGNCRFGEESEVEWKVLRRWVPSEFMWHMSEVLPGIDVSYHLCSFVTRRVYMEFNGIHVLDVVLVSLTF